MTSVLIAKGTVQVDRCRGSAIVRGLDWRARVVSVRPGIRNENGLVCAHVDVNGRTGVVSVALGVTDDGIAVASIHLYENVREPLVVVPGDS